MSSEDSLSQREKVGHIETIHNDDENVARLNGNVENVHQ